MKHVQIRTAAQQLAEYLKEEIRKGTWVGTMPGECRLVADLQVGRDTVRGAMQHLESEGVVESTGQGQRRRILMRGLSSKHSYRVTILLYDAESRYNKLIQDLMYRLSEEGYAVEIAPNSLVEVGMNVERVAKLVKQVDTDAWVIGAASSEVLGWFASQDRPVFAIFGSFRGYEIAGVGPNKLWAYQTALRRLVELGHSRIVLMPHEQSRKPKIGKLLQGVLAEMEALGIKVGNYHLPDWERTPSGLRKCLSRMFEITPPTAIFVEEACEFFAVQHYLARRGIFAPRDVSLICSDDDAYFEWAEPAVGCIRWQSHLVVRHVVRWARIVSNGMEDKRQTFLKATFVEGGTVGPVRRG